MVVIVLPEGANVWLSVGERGVSSEAIFEKMTGICVGRHFGFSTHPRDPDDFKRCERLLITVPSFRARLDEMREVSNVWDKLVEHWQEIVGLIAEEVPGIWDGEVRGGRAPRAYDLMESLGC